MATSVTRHSTQNFRIDGNFVLVYDDVRNKGLSPRPTLGAYPYTEIEWIESWDTGDVLEVSND
jgi:hypothetical protein